MPHYTDPIMAAHGHHAVVSELSHQPYRVAASRSRVVSASTLLTRSLFDAAIDAQRNGRPQQAAAAYAQILRLDPSHAGSHHMLGLLARQAGRHDMALDMLRKATTFAPSELRYRYDLLAFLRETGQIEEESIWLHRTGVQFPARADIHARLGLLLCNAGRYAEAIERFAASAAIAPDAEVHCYWGLCLAALQRFDEALPRLREAIRLRPDFVEAHNDLGLTLIQFGRFDEAREHFHTALRLRPDLPETHVNLGNALRIIGEIDDAEASFRAALRLRPDYAQAHYGLALLLLISGRLEEGWREMEWRSAMFPERPLPQPRWNGESLNGRTLLLHTQQGLGDAIQFCRYVPELARHERIVLELPRSLLRLMSSLDGNATIIERDTPLPGFDLHCPLERLPFIAGTSLTSVPDAVPYLHAEPRAIAAWRSRLAGHPGRHVGIAWAGNPDHQDDRRRSVPLRLFAPLAAMPGVVFVSLQKGAGSEQAASPPPGMVLLDWTGELQDFADTAALVAALDLVISVDTAIVHLAGSLARPVWLLNRFDTCWRWLHQRDDSPWYPTLRQFRQTRFDGWDEPIAQMRAALQQLL
jgi:tetratricopeptide (TPR) repeat protein